MVKEEVVLVQIEDVEIKYSFYLERKFGLREIVLRILSQLYLGTLGVFFWTLVSSGNIDFNGGQQHWFSVSLRLQRDN
jgi:hypothetical protein